MENSEQWTVFYKNGTAELLWGEPAATPLIDFSVKGDVLNDYEFDIATKTWNLKSVLNKE